MAVSPSLKIASVVVGTGGVITGGAVGVHNYLSKSNEEGKKEDINTSSTERTETNVVPTAKPITTLLSEENLKLMDKSTAGDGEWKNKWTTFKGKYTSNEPQGNWNFTNWANLKDNVNAPESFQDKCIENSKREVLDKAATLYVEIKENCATTNAT